MDKIKILCISEGGGGGLSIEEWDPKYFCWICIWNSSVSGLEKAYPPQGGYGISCTIPLPFDNFLIHGLSWAVAIVMNKVMENSIRTIKIAVCSELK